MTLAWLSLQWPSFRWPWALVALAAVPLLAAMYVWRERRRAASVAGFAQQPLLPHVVDRSPGPRRHIPLILLLVALGALLVGVARPHATVSVQREEATVMLAVDTSRSMSSKDVSPTRLGAAVRGVTAFLQEIPERYRVGLVTFASRAALSVAPTFDRAAVLAGLASVRSGEGTALGDAVGISVASMKRLRAPDGTAPPSALLIVSDGASTAGRLQPAAAARQAAAAKMPIYSVLLGTEEGTVERTITGGYTEIIRVPPSPATLRQISRLSGGKLYTAATGTRLREVYEGLASRLGSTTSRREVTDVFAAGAGGILILAGLLSALWFRRTP